MLDKNKKELTEVLKKLPEFGLTVLTGGNASIRDKESNLVVIKPSGMPYEDLSTGNLVVVDLEGKVVEGELNPSSDTLSHVFIYSHLPAVNGIVHTHSPYVTAFAAVGISIPVLFTETAEEFGGEVPCTDFVLIGDEAIGDQVVQHAQGRQAVVLKKHGLFTFSETLKRAFELAVLAEETAKVAWLSMQLGNPESISQDDIDALYFRQQNIYGQK